FGHSRPRQLTPLLACASSKTSAPLPTEGPFFERIELQCWIVLPSSCSLPAWPYALFDGDPVRPLFGHTALTGGDQQAGPFLTPRLGAAVALYRMRAAGC